MAGFGLRISPNGKKKFVFHYYSKKEKAYRKITYKGSYPDLTLAMARKLYSRDKEKVATDQNPAEGRTRKKIAEENLPTVSELIDIWEEQGLLKGLAAIKDRAQTVRRDFGRKFSSVKINEITQDDITAVNDDILARGSPGAALESWQSIRTMLNFAVSRYGAMNDNPANKMTPPAEKGSRDRVLSPKEIYLFWQGINNSSINPVVCAALKMMLVTLQRGSEVRQAEWSRIHSEEAVWEIPKELTKNRIFHRVALNKYALELIEEMKGYTIGSPFVFGISPYHTSKITPEREDLKIMARSTLANNIKAHLDNWGIERFTPHDLRRTATTLLTGVGIPRFIVKRALNHSDESTATAIYDRYAYDFEKQMTAKVLAFILDEILAAERVDVVPSIMVLRERVRNADVIPAMMFAYR